MLHSEDLLSMTLQEIHDRIGQKVETYAAGIGTLVIIGDGGWAIRMRLRCIRGCRRTHTVYLRRGCAGPDHYAHNFKGEYVADLRDQVFNCGQHSQ